MVKRKIRNLSAGSDMNFSFNKTGMVYLDDEFWIIFHLEKFSQILLFHLLRLIDRSFWNSDKWTWGLCSIDRPWLSVDCMCSRALFIWCPMLEIHFIYLFVFSQFPFIKYFVLLLFNTHSIMSIMSLVLLSDSPTTEIDV